MKTGGMTPRRKRLFTGLAIALGLGVVMGLAYNFSLFSSLDLRTSDLLFQPKTQDATSRKVVIVSIDDKSLADLGQFQSWPRSHYAVVIDNLSKAGARAVVVDLLFSEPGTGDAQLAQSVAAAGNVIMPEVGSDASGAYTEPFLKPLPELASAVYALGATNITPDADGIVRKLPAVVSYGTDVPALSLAAVAKYLERPSVLESGIDNGALQFNGRNLPLVDGNQLLINYRHAADNDSAFTQVSFSDVVNGTVDPAVFKGRIVLIGATATGLGDYFWTPLGRMNGVEIHANAISMILDASFLKPVSRPYTLALIGLLALACGYVSIRWKMLKSLAACAVVLTACVIGAIMLFNDGRQLSVFYPPVTVLGTMLAVNTYGVAAGRRQQGEMRRTFGLYVSPTVASKILESIEEGSLQLGGQEQAVTVMFADVRGYTRLSRATETPELVAILNTHLSAIIDAVIRNDGIVNKFAGDNIMALWNAPEHCTEHALQAVKAALDAQSALAQLWEKRPEMPRMEFGIGINTGAAVAGNMGSEDRLEYSVIGDTVNYASRITDAAPAGSIWIGAATYEMVKDDIETRPVENITVKEGKLPFDVFEATSLKRSPGERAGGKP
jgi:adenylate cyclase